MLRRSLLAAAPLLLGARAALAQDFPARPLRLVVPYGAGGSPDRLARGFADALGAELHQPVVVVNMPGAGGNIGHQYVAAAPADGYTLLMTATGSMAIRKPGRRSWAPPAARRTCCSTSPSQCSRWWRPASCGRSRSRAGNARASFPTFPRSPSWA